MILVVLRSPCADCGGTVFPPEVAGWTDPTTGIFTAGPAPTGCGSCSTACAETVCVQRCDDTNGDGLADTTYSELWCVRDDGTTSLLLTYQDDPSTPYAPVAPVDCEHGSMACHTQLLCDDSGPFLRRFTFVSDGTAGYVDVALDGEAPHVVMGTVRDCSQTSDCEQPREPAATVGLCLADGTPIAAVVTRDCQGVTREEGWINLTTGAYSTGQPPAGTVACGESRSISTTGTFCDVDANGNVVGLVLIEYTYAADGSVSSVRLVDATTGQAYTAQGTITTCPAGVDQPEQDLVVLCDIAADGTVTRFIRDFRRDENGQIVGHTDYTLAGAPYTVTGTVGQCPTEVPGPVPVIPQVFHGELVLCDDNGPFIRKLVQDAAGAVTAVVSLTLDGAPYTPVGTVAQCVPEAEPCRTASTLLVCDLPSGGEPTPTVSDTNPTAYQGAGLGAEPLPGGAAALWSGGAITIPADTGPGPGHINQHLRSVAANLQAERPGCDTGTATITASIRVQRTGPSSAFGGNGIWSLWSGGTRVAVVTTPNNAPVGYTGTLTVSGQVSAADVAAGDVHLASALETWHTAAHVGGWIVDQFTARVVYDQAGCETQFLRSVTLDCDGAVTAVTDTTLDGDPYEPTGEVGQCTPASTPPATEPCRNASTLLLCDLPADGAPTPTLTDTPGAPYYPYTTGVATPGAQALWDGGTLTLPAASGPQPGTGGTVRTAAAVIQAPRPVCDAGTAHVTVQVDVTQLGPDNGCRATGFLGLYNGPGDANRVGLALAPPDTPAGWTGTLTTEADVPAADLAAGNIAVVVAFDAYDDSGATCPPPRRTGWQLDEFAATVVYDQTGCDTQFLRNVTTDCETGAVVSVTDTTLDGEPYTVTGEPGQCQAGGGECCPEPPCPARNIVQAERCDDTDGDGIADAWYVELLGVDCTGTPTSLGTYTCDLSTPYTPVAPVDCDTPDPVVERPVGVQAHRVQLAPGKVWDASQYGTLRAVQATARGGTGTVITADGTSTLFDGETAQWSITRDMDVRLIGPLTITATTGAVVVNWTEGVDL
jgi:hypothetical protein